MWRAGAKRRRRSLLGGGTPAEIGPMPQGGRRGRRRVAAPGRARRRFGQQFVEQCARAFVSREQRHHDRSAPSSNATSTAWWRTSLTRRPVTLLSTLSRCMSPSRKPAPRPLVTQRIVGRRRQRLAETREPTARLGHGIAPHPVGHVLSWKSLHDATANAQHGAGVKAAVGIHRGRGRRVALRESCAESHDCVDNRIRVNIILRQVGYGNVHFWSVIPYWKTAYYKDIHVVDLSLGRLEDD